MRHILITGERGAGKSTLIRRLLAETRRPLAGFVTERVAPDPDGFYPIYLHRAAETERFYTDQNRIGRCNRRSHEVALDVFNTLGVACLNASPGALLVMDELGFLEADAARFVAKVFEALDGDAPILAAVKRRSDVPFLNAVRAHPRATVYELTPDNREAVFETLRPIIGAL